LDVARFVDVARLPDIPIGAGLAVEISRNRVALFHIDGEVFATDNTCIRCSAELAAGTVDGHDVECAQCGWRYDVVTGSTRGVPKLRLETFGVRMSGTTVMLRG
jgi:naphthalene 1,2-dioxygenase ferredoxin component